MLHLSTVTVASKPQVLGSDERRLRASDRGQLCADRGQRVIGLNLRRCGWSAASPRRRLRSASYAA